MRTLRRSQSIDIIKALRSRKSIRGYKPDPVPKRILKEILEVASRSPSAKNAQPWEMTVVAGEVLEQIKRGNLEMLASVAIPNPDVPYKDFHGVYKGRQVALAIQLFELMGIDRKDRDKRAEWNQRELRFFDAPAAIILTVDTSLDESATQFDLGIITHAIRLAALNYGLATCINGQAIIYPEVVRRFTGIPESKRITMSIAIGYPNWDFPANKLESKREPVESITSWYGFDRAALGICQGKLQTQHFIVLF